MDIFSKNRFMVWLIICLIISNIIALSAFLYFNFKSQPKNETAEENNVQKFLKSELNFNQKQQIEFDSLISKYLITAKKSRDEIRIIHKETNNLIFQDFEKSLIDFKFDTIGTKKADLDKLTFYFLRNVYLLCSDEQKLKFKQIYRELSAMITPNKSASPKKKD